MRTLLLLLLTSCATTHVPPCAAVAQPAQRFACSQLPVCKYNCAVTIVITDGGNAPQTVTGTTTQTRAGFHVGPTGPQP